MRVANTVELKNKTNELLRHVTSGDPVIITLWGKPAAALTRLTEADLEAFVLEHAPRHDRDTMRFTGPYRYLSLSSPLGTVYVAYSDRGVCAVDLAGSDATFARAFRQRFGHPVSRDPHPPRSLTQRLRRFFSSLNGFEGAVDLSLVGPFERRVLEQLRRIPRGQVRTYRDIARAIGHPGATRAVGNACAKNPVPLIIPCHRVVRSDGGLGGYSLRGGVAVKRKLLEQEGVDFRGLRTTLGTW